MQPEEQMRKMSRRSLLWAAGATVGGFWGLRWIASAGKDGGLPATLRRGLTFSEGVARSTFSAHRLSPTFDEARVEPLRVNGLIGLSQDLDAQAWRLSIESGDTRRLLTLDEIRGLGHHVEYVTELRCVEGWSRVFRWGGVRLADVLSALFPSAKPNSVGISTPDGEYYVGLDWPSVMHPQTLLCYEMNGAPLLPEHGAPLRLAMPVKYGYKQIKRIGVIRLSQARAPDYWAERGYDWYAGL
jgi:DMSO/TMAO reductase YedYZ molybdopterin-dependent catalytic subunit